MRSWGFAAFFLPETHIDAFISRKFAESRSKTTTLGLPKRSKDARKIRAESKTGRNRYVFSIGFFVMECLIQCTIAPFARKKLCSNAPLHRGAVHFLNKICSIAKMHRFYRKWRISVHSGKAVPMHRCTAVHSIFTQKQ